MLSPWGKWGTEGGFPVSSRAAGCSHPRGHTSIHPQHPQRATSLPCSHHGDDAGPCQQQRTLALLSQRDFFTFPFSISKPTSNRSPGELQGPEPRGRLCHPTPQS